MVKISKTRREALTKQIVNLAILGLSGIKIAEELDMPERTVHHYLRAHREKRAKEQLGRAEEIVGELIESQENRIKHIYGIVASGTKGEKLKAITLLQHEDIMKVKRHQIVGNLPTEAPQIAIQNNNVIEGVTSIADAIRIKCPELANRFKNNKMKVIDDGKDNDKS